MWIPECSFSNSFNDKLLKNAFPQRAGEFQDVKRQKTYNHEFQFGEFPFGLDTDENSFKHRIIMQLRQQLPMNTLKMFFEVLALKLFKNTRGNTSFGILGGVLFSRLVIL